MRGKCANNNLFRFKIQKSISKVKLEVGFV